MLFWIASSAYFQGEGEKSAKFNEFENYLEDFEKRGGAYSKLSSEILQDIRKDLLEPKEKTKIRKALDLESGKSYAQLVQNIKIAEESLKIFVNSRHQLKQQVIKTDVEEIGSVIANFLLGDHELNTNMVSKLINLIKLEITDENSEYLGNSFTLILKVDGNVRCFLVHYYVDKSRAAFRIELIHINFTILTNLHDEKIL